MNMLPRRYFLVFTFFAVSALVFLSVRQNGTHLKQVDTWIHSGSKGPKGESRPCTHHLGWLENYQFSYPIRYISRDIVTMSSPKSARPALTVMNTPLFDEFAIVDLTKSTTVPLQHCLPPLVLEVPRLNLLPVDASNMIFGLQTTIRRLKDTVKHLARWLPHTNARLFAIVIENEETPANNDEMAALQKQFHDLDMNVTIIHPLRPKDSFAQRYFSLVEVMYTARNEKTQWVTFIDDDTFFPSMQDLQTMLGKYNSIEPQYIGSLSEDWWAVKHYGLMGFGGAGVFLSLPMAEIIYKNRKACSESPRTTAGDITVMDCIYRFSSVKLTHVPGLHQVDMHGDLSGFYESGREMLSLHHWKEGSAAGYKLEMEKMHLVADVCDSCFLQRWKFSDDMVLSNGFSINVYPQGHLSSHKGFLPVGPSIKKIDLANVEYTWGDDINVLHSMAPTREKMTEEAKLGYKLLDSTAISDGGPGVRQVYFREGKETESSEREMDTVMILNWRVGDNAKESSVEP